MKRSFFARHVSSIITVLKEKLKKLPFLDFYEESKRENNVARETVYYIMETGEIGVTESRRDDVAAYTSIGSRGINRPISIPRNQLKIPRRELYSSRRMCTFRTHKLTSESSDGRMTG